VILLRRFLLVVAVVCACTAVPGSATARPPAGNAFELVVLAAAASPPVTLRGVELACPPRIPRAGFRDVSSSDVHARAISCMAWWDLTGGLSPTAFAPGSRVNRAQMSSFVAREIEGAGYVLPASPGDAFGDDNGSVHEVRINQLAAVGVVAGVTPTSFRPGDFVTRGQMATFLVRAHDLVAARDLVADGSRFGDDTGSVHEASIDKCATAGLAGGTGSGSFSPLEPVSRAQLASFLARSLDLLVSTGEVDAPTAPPIRGDASSATVEPRLLNDPNVLWVGTFD